MPRSSSQCPRANSGRNDILLSPRPIIQGEERDRYIGSDQELFIRQATEQGHEIVEPGPTEQVLLVDLEDGGISLFRKRLGRLRKLEPITAITYKPSTTAGHYHAIVTLTRRVPLFNDRQMPDVGLRSLSGIA